ncbi:flagellar protein FlaG [Shewanella marinintestina]|uniref:flagellar protein FlaG n=1 Tax=Shewanella marinintestina TaxID=190305 RepID=UPI00200FD02B|nr:flagellar protein FlaG [Shewanella marinintestina]MCL1145272.1 flagellar protein FlaG [Shewanella marinintestina]
MDVNFTSATNPIAVKQELTSTQTEVDSIDKAVLFKESSSVERTSLAKDSEEKTADIHEVANELNDMMSLMRKGLAFKVDEHSGQSIVSVLDVDSGDIIRQIPNEEALELAQKLAEVAGSLLKTEA